MDTFTFDPRCWCIGRILGRNPLLRRSDRVEALVAVVAFVVSLVAIPVAGVVGAIAYGAREGRYAQQARERHIVMATVTGIRVDGSDVSVVAKWPVAAGERVGSVHPRTEAKVGERIGVWIDKSGNTVVPPTPTWHAVGDAIGTVMVTMLIVSLGMTSLVAGVRSRLDRTRDAQWERALRCLHEDEGRRNQR
ncbi:hypothetical protein [Mycobacterium sp.]|uniref:Rv1733c family protein n=1 Tax=Mycobacterium sp. TaxID=1785 RepID=UPI002D0AB68A|nr:hypothetical protein [Mycobacterium sp.]HTQ15831.1 hypothetical protein [Mycobacterium sp.]